MRRVVVECVLALALAAPAAGHVPGTATGQAVQVLRAVPVSYENGAAVTELEADGFLRLPGVGEGISIAAMPGSALREVAGGPNAIADEIAREAPLRGALVVVAGCQLGAWSDEIPAGRLRALVHAAARAPGGAGPQVIALVSSIRTEPRAAPQEDGPPWTAILVAAAFLGVLGILVIALGRRPRGRRQR